MFLCAELKVGGFRPNTWSNSIFVWIILHFLIFCSFSGGIHKRQIHHSEGATWNLEEKLQSFESGIDKALQKKYPS